jgi:hypothetical protein
MLHKKEEGLPSYRQWIYENKKNPACNMREEVAAVVQVGMHKWFGKVRSPSYQVL